MSDTGRRLAEVIDALRARRQTVATAESITAGGVCAALTSVAGASEVVRGGLVVYATDTKVTLAGVSAELLEAKGTVDPEVARALARGARERLAADWGIGLTGVAGPGPAEGLPAGTVHVGLSGPAVDEVRSLRLSGDRKQVRAGAVGHAIDLLREHLTASRR